MWVFLSSRIRTWLLLAVAVPVIRRVLQRLAAARARKHPDAKSVAALHRADAGLGALAGRKRGRRRRRDER